MQVTALLAQNLLIAYAHAQRRFCGNHADALTRHAHRRKRLRHCGFIRRTHLQHDAEFFVEQRVERRRIWCKLQRHTSAAGEHHFAHRGEQPAIGSVVISQYPRLIRKYLFLLNKFNNTGWRFEVGRNRAGDTPCLRQRRAAHPRLPVGEIDQQQHRVTTIHAQLRC